MPPAPASETKQAIPEMFRATPKKQLLDSLGLVIDMAAGPPGQGGEKSRLVLTGPESAVEACLAVSDQLGLSSRKDAPA